MTAAGVDRSFVIPLGFAMTVSMWAVAYVCRLPAVMAPSWLVLGLMLGSVAGWGWITGARSGGGWVAGVAVGAVSAVLNMLILGSLLASASDGSVVPSALWWVPGSIVVVALISGGFAAVAGRAEAAETTEGWTALFSKVAVTATFLLVVAGGLVTSSEAGLAVVDWPNTFGSNMFLFPLARMTGGVYYEHAHRLFGARRGAEPSACGRARVVCGCERILHGGSRGKGEGTKSETPAIRFRMRGLAAERGSIYPSPHPGVTTTTRAPTKTTMTRGWDDIASRVKQGATRVKAPLA